MKSIIAALIAAKKEFGPALKKRTNPHLKNQYAGLEECLDAVNDALVKNNVFFTQEVTESEFGAIVETVFWHESGESLKSGKLFVPSVKKDAQGFGSALTYARRYSLMTACGIAAEDDDGSHASSSRSNPVNYVDPAPIISEIKKYNTEGELVDYWRKNNGLFIHQLTDHAAFKLAYTARIKEIRLAVK